MIGRSYLLNGQPVTVRARWAPHSPPGTPRNVLVEHAAGLLVVRPFRGLRKATAP